MTDAHDQRYARYAEGLNDFRYCATLCVEHPSLNIAEISSAFGFAPDSAHEKGDERRRPNGELTGKVWDKAYWRKKLRPKDGNSLDEFVQTLVGQLEPRKAALQDIQRSGGVMDCFVGIFARSLCDTQFSWELLERLAELRINLRLDYYSDGRSDSNRSME